jgi:hypothetical protein
MGLTEYSVDRIEVSRLIWPAPLALPQLVEIQELFQGQFGAFLTAMVFWSRKEFELPIERVQK